MKKIKKSIFDKRDTFEISDGNMLVLKTIPEMMKDEEFRNKLRELVFDFTIKNKTRRNVDITW